MTPAVDSIREAGIKFSLHDYAHDPGESSFGLEAAMKLGVDPGLVFKTLVVKTEIGQLGVGIVPVTGQLSLKAMARALGCKKVAMAPAADVERATGYVLGGVSPLGQKRSLPTVIDVAAEAIDQIYVSGGRRGLEIALAPADLAALTRGDFASIAA